MTEAVGHLIKALAGTEASRRVGWARSYTAEERLDQALRDQEELRVQRDIMRGAASFLFGFVTGRGDGIVDEALHRWRKEVAAVFDPEVVRAGRKAAEDLADRDERRFARDERRRMLMERSAAWANHQQQKNRKPFQAGRVKERKNLISSYGFPDEEAFLEHLAAYRKGER